MYFYWSQSSLRVLLMVHIVKFMLYIRLRRTYSWNELSCGHCHIRSALLDGLSQTLPVNLSL